MADKHTQIQTQVILDWTASGRGRLYILQQGTFRYMYNDGCITISPYPASKNSKKINGYPDLYGFEFIPYFYYDDHQFKEKPIPVYCLIEVKTKASPTITRKQMDHLDYCLSIDGKAYVARETDEGYSLVPWPC